MRTRRDKIWIWTIYRIDGVICAARIRPSKSPARFEGCVTARSAKGAVQAFIDYCTGIYNETPEQP